MNKKRLAGGVVGLVMVLGLMLAVRDTEARHGQRGFTTQSIAGTYAVRCTGHVTPPGGSNLVPAVGQGTAIGDAAGGVKAEATLSVGGQVLKQRFEGLASVNPDGTGTIVYEVQLVLPDGSEIPAPDSHITFLILDEGKELWGMPVDEGSALACNLKRMVKATQVH